VVGRKGWSGVPVRCASAQPVLTPRCGDAPGSFRTHLGLAEDLIGRSAADPASVVGAIGVVVVEVSSQVESDAGDLGDEAAGDGGFSAFLEDGVLDPFDAPLVWALPARLSTCRALSRRGSSATGWSGIRKRSSPSPASSLGRRGVGHGSTWRVVQDAWTRGVAMRRQTGAPPDSNDVDSRCGVAAWVAQSIATGRMAWLEA
jgi:hypothetical protein